MSKVKRPQITGPTYDDRDEAPAAPRPQARGPVRRARDVPYSVAWFRDRIATYALGTIICGALMLTVAAWMGGTLGRFGQNMNNGFNVIAGWAGMAIKGVDVCGPGATTKNPCPELDPQVVKQVLEASGVGTGVATVSADPYAIRDRVDELEVGTASVRRLWPDRVRIEIDQRQVVALWQEQSNGGAWRVVDQNGRAFEKADLTKYADLPRVIGANAARAATGLVAALRDYPNLAERFEAAYRIGERRWDIKFRGRADLVVMPEDGKLKEALDCVNLQHAANDLLNLPAMRIDARRENCTLAIQPIPGAPPVPAPGDA
jgi:cell division protein FtsQ